jgi:hypothetical protein
MIALILWAILLVIFWPVALVIALLWLLLISARVLIPMAVLALKVSIATALAIWLASKALYGRVSA